MAHDKLLTPVKIDVVDRLKFVQAVFNARQKGLGWKPAFAEANLIFPKHKRLSSGIDHPNKLTWMTPMYEMLEKDSKSKTKIEPKPSKGLDKPVVIQKIESPKRAGLSDDEKMKFAQNFIEAPKANPAGGNLYAIREANKHLPEHRRIGKTIDCLNQIPWLAPLLEKLQSPPAKTHILTDAEKASFAEIVYKLRKGNATWSHAIREANKFLPEDRKIGAKICNPSQTPWIIPLLDQLALADKNRRVIDHRGTLPKAEDPVPESKKERKYSETRTYWNEEDKRFFAEVAYQLKVANPGWGWQKVLDEANQEMPGHKRRASMPPSKAALSWLSAMLDEVARRPAPAPEPEPVKVPEIVQPAPAPVMDMQAMMMAAFEKVAREQMAGLNMTSLPSAPVVNTKPPEKQERKKVVVVGLLPVQTNEIQKRFGHVFNFKFIGSNTPNQQIRASIEHGDIGILMTRFVSHSTQAAMRDHPGFTFCNGNSTALENLLEEKIVKIKAGQ